MPIAGVQGVTYAPPAATIPAWPDACSASNWWMGCIGWMKGLCWMGCSFPAGHRCDDLWEQSHGAAIQREMLPFVLYVLRYGVKTLCGIERLNALPSLLVSDEALMPLVGFNAQQGRDGVCQRGGTKRQGERPPGPMCPDTLAKNIVKWQLPDLEVVFNGAMRALAKAGVFGAKVTGIADGTDLETTERYTGCGQVTRQVRIEDKQGRVHAIEVTA
jgi:hypothetical protein